MDSKVEAGLLVAVHPNAHRSEVVSFSDSVLHLKIAAPPVEGKANKEVIEFLSRALKVPKSHIVIEKGLSSRRKKVVIKGLSLPEVLRRLNVGPEGESSRSDGPGNHQARLNI